MRGLLTGAPKNPYDSLYIYIYIYIHTHLYVYIYIYIYTYTMQMPDPRRGARARAGGETLRRGAASGRAGQHSKLIVSVVNRMSFTFQ